SHLSRSSPPETGAIPHCGADAAGAPGRRDCRAWPRHASDNGGRWLSFNLYSPAAMYSIAGLDRSAMIVRIEQFLNLADHARLQARCSIRTPSQKAYQPAAGTIAGGPGREARNADGGARNM